MGISKIFAVGSRERCCGISKFYNATEIINYKKEGIVELILKATHRKGVDKVFIAGGDCKTFAQAVMMLKPRSVTSNVNCLVEGIILNFEELNRNWNGT